MVVTVDRGRYTVMVDGALTTAMRARELGRKSIAVGDEVALVGDVGGGPDSLARIVRIEPRRSVLRRTADDVDPVERVLVANAVQLAIVVAAAEPEPRPRLIDRCLVAAYDAGLQPLLVVTKTDLAPAEELLAAYDALDLPVARVRSDQPPDEVRARLLGRMTVLVGHSGVGKSTLVNALVPGAGRSTGVVNAVTGRGRHTSSSALALRLDGDSWIVDTPGVRSFGIAHVEPSTVIGAFPDLAGGLERCPRGCTHDEPECGLDGWVAGGHASAARLQSLRRLLRSGRSEET